MKKSLFENSFFEVFDIWNLGLKDVLLVEPYYAGS